MRAHQPGFREPTLSCVDVPRVAMSALAVYGHASRICGRHCPAQFDTGFHQPSVQCEDGVTGKFWKQ